MKITMFAAGSRGDIQPCAVLGGGLRNAGFEVQLAAPENFAELASEYGLSFCPLRGDVQQIMASEAGQDFMETGSRNPIAAVRAIRTMLGPVALQMAEDCLQACRGTDALISLAVFAPFSHSVSSLLNIPLMMVEPTPVLPTSAFPAPGWPVQRNLGALHNRLSGRAMLQFIWLWYRPFVNEFRQSHGLHPYSGSAFYRVLNTLPLLGGYSPRVISRPSDWPASAHITGYWFAGKPPEWEPPRDLAAFLDAGEPPVCVGFGSMAGQEPEKLAAMVLEALVRTNQRGLLLTGWGGLRAGSLPDNVFVLASAPHDWLFPRMSAVVHHGGAGTTAESLRAGVPTVIIPFIVDQPFWGMRVADLGVGPRPIPHKKLTVALLSEAIEVAVTNRDMKSRAQTLGETIRAENGVANAIELIKQYLSQQDSATKGQHYVKNT